jgi:hypothetical protein
MKNLLCCRLKKFCRMCQCMPSFVYLIIIVSIDYTLTCSTLIVNILSTSFSSDYIYKFMLFVSNQVSHGSVG